MKKSKIVGVIFLLMSLYFFYKRYDVIRELLGGRDINQIEIEGLLLPSILMVIGLIFSFKKTKNDEKKS